MRGPILNLIMNSWDIAPFVQILTIFIPPQTNLHMISIPQIYHLFTLLLPFSLPAAYA